MDCVSIWPVRIQLPQSYFQFYRIAYFDWISSTEAYKIILGGLIVTLQLFRDISIAVCKYLSQFYISPT